MFLSPRSTISEFEPICRWSIQVGTNCANSATAATTDNPSATTIRRRSNRAMPAMPPVTTSVNTMKVA